MMHFITVKKRIGILSGAILWACALGPADAAELTPQSSRLVPENRPDGDDPALRRLTEYRHELTAFRREFPATRALPEVAFFLFGRDRAPSFYTNPER